jgi:hypothetical protein
MFRRWIPFIDSKTSIARTDVQIGPNDINLYTLSDWGVSEQERFGFKARPGIEPWPMALPLDWSEDPYKDTNWKFSLHAWRMTDPILRSYFTTGDADLLSKAFKFVEDWYRFHYVESRTAEFSWYDMAVGIRAMRIAFFINKVQSGELNIDESALTRLYRMADDHAMRLQDGAFIKINNHGLFQVFGLNLLCTVARTRASCANGRYFAQRMYEKIFDSQFTQDGVHCEHSPHYHWFAESRITALASGNGIKSPRAESILAQAREVLPWLTFPDGSIASVGDSNGTSIPLRKAGKQNLRRIGDKSLYAIGDFSRSGYAVVRSNPTIPVEQQSMLFVTGMMWSYTHKHADDLSFELFEKGKFILIDSGKYGYVRDAMRTYVESAAAHNTISVETKDITPRSLRPYGSALESIKQKDDHFEIAGSISRPGLFDQRRRLLYRPGDYLVVHDQLKARSTDRLVSSLHFAPELDVSLSQQTAEAELGNDCSVKIQLICEECSIHSARGQNNPIRGWATTGYLEMKPATTLRAICPSGNHTITWVISFNEAAHSRAMELALSTRKAGPRERSSLVQRLVRRIHSLRR